MRAGRARRRLFAGSYTDGESSEGIRTLAFDEAEKTLRVERAGGHAPNPSFLARRGSRLFAAHELEDRGCLAAYAIEGNGALRCLGACSSPRDAGTCFVIDHPSGRCLYGANYESGSVSCCTLLPDGRLAAGLPSVRHKGRGLRGDRQEAPHVHTLSFVPGTQLLVAVDLGIDALVLYRTGACGAIAPEPVETVQVPAGSGPRMVAYHPRLPLAALVNELACDVLAFRFDATGTGWRQAGRFELPRMPDGGALAAHIAFAPDGRQLYASVRGSERIVRFAIDEGGGVGSRADFTSGGRGPRQFSLSSDGRFLAVANLASDDVCVLARDAENGALRAVARASVPQPACVVWDE